MNFRPLISLAPNNATRALFWSALLAELALVATMRLFGNLAVHGNPVRFVGMFLVAGLAYFVALAGYEHIAPQWRPKYFWGAAILFRLAALSMPPGDDFWRYLWEGKLQLHSINPYQFSPDSPELFALRDAAIWPLVNHRDFAAIYPPGTELLFARLAAISPTPLFFKSVFALIDLVTLWLLLRLNTGPGRFRKSAWYAWNPLVICSFAGAGHFDSVMVASLVAAIWALFRANPLDQQKPAWSWSLLSAIFLGIAISLKIIPIFLLPVWAFALGGRSVVLLVSVAIPAGLSALYGGLAMVTQSLREFARVTRFNDAVWWLVERTVWANPEQKNTGYNLIIAAVALALAVFFRKDWRRGVLWVLGALLILTPALHPWYLTWILPVACWRKNHAWFVFSISIAVCLVVWESGPFWSAWQVNVPLRALMFAPPLLTLLFFQSRKPGNQQI